MHALGMEVMDNGLSQRPKKDQVMEDNSLR